MATPTTGPAHTPGPLMLNDRPIQPPARLPVLAAFAAIYLFWGSNFLAIRFAVETIPPFVLMGVRSFIAGVCLLAWGVLRGDFRVTSRQLASAAAAGLLLFVVGHGGLAWAQRSVPSSIAALVMATIPLWMVLLEWALGATAPRPMTWMGLASGLAGIALLTAPSSRGGSFALSPLAVGVMLMSAFGWASGSVAARRLPHPASVAVATGLQLTCGGAALCALAWATGSFAAPIHPSWRSLVAMLYMIVVASIVTLTAYVWLLRVSTPARVGSYAFVNPVVAVIMGWAFAGEMLTSRMLVAAAVIVLGVVLIVSPAPGGARTRTR